MARVALVLPIANLVTVHAGRVTMLLLSSVRPTVKEDKTDPRTPRQEREKLATPKIAHPTVVADVVASSPCVN
jgi:hypothetical protein